MRRPRRPAQNLRFTIECLPRRTRIAMLQGIEANTIIVGAYTDRDGGICPMLAAHRNGGRTDFASFARAWDRYTRVAKRARPATGRELRTLKAMLEGSLSSDEYARGELAEAVREFEAIKARRVERERAEAEAARSERAPEEARPGSGDEVEDPVAGDDFTRPARARVDTGERDRSSELATRPGWAWLRVFRRLDEYEAAVERVRRAERTVEQRERELV